MEKEKFEIGGKGNIDENIKRLQREFDESVAGMKGAPRIKEESAKKEKKREKAVERGNDKAVMREKEIPRKTYVSPYEGIRSNSVESFNIFKSSRFYIVVFGVAAFGFLIFKAPVFRYTTPFRPDNDLPQIEVGFKYYNNLFGKQTKSETVVNIGKTKFTVRIPMSEWVNMSKDKKLVVLKYVQK